MTADPIGKPAVNESIEAEQTPLPSWSEIAPCDDKPAPAGRQKQQLFAKENFSD